MRAAGTDALYWRIELGASGHVHAHMLASAPFLNKAWLESLVNRGSAYSGFLHLKRVDNQAKGIREVSKYATKMPGPRAENWWTRPQAVISPELAGNWDIALENKTTSGFQGAWYGQLDDTPDGELERESSAVEQDDDLECLHCGRREGFFWSPRPTLDWVRACHRLGQPAMYGSGWRPPEQPSDDFEIPF